MPKMVNEVTRKHFNIIRGDTNPKPKSPSGQKSRIILEKYKELFCLSKEALNEEMSRFNRIDQKAPMFLSALTLIVGIYGYVVTLIMDSILPPQDFLE